MSERKNTVEQRNQQQLIALTTLVVGRKWHPVIVHRLLQHESLGFMELKREMDGISDRVLADSLEYLMEKRLIEREVVSERPLRVAYSLTERGTELEPVVDAMCDWGQEHLTSPDKFPVTP